MCGIGSTECPEAASDVNFQPEFIRLHVLTKKCKVSGIDLVGKTYLLSLRCVIVMGFSLLKRGDQKGKNILRCPHGR